MSTEPNTEREPLTVAAVMQLSMLIQAAQREWPVRRLMKRGEVFEGTVRALVVSPDRPVSPGKGDDVRDCYLRVSSTFEHFWPVAELVPLVGTGELGLG